VTHPLDVSRLHRDAIKALLDAAFEPLQVDGRYKVYDGQVTDKEDEIVYPYLVIWPGPAVRSSGHTMNGSTGAAVTTTQITAAGISTDEVLAALDRAAAALDRQIPAVPGRRFEPVTQVPGAPPPAPERDDRVSTPDGRPVFFSSILVTLRSHPAAA